MRKYRYSEQDILDGLEDLLEGQYDRLLRNVKFHRRGLDGEQDLQAWQRTVFDYYEVKASLHPRAEARAYRQFERSRRAWGKMLRYCYLVVPAKHGLEIYGPIQF